MEPKDGIKSRDWDATHMPGPGAPEVVLTLAADEDVESIVDIFQTSETQTNGL
jgi:hypothetical protein